MTSPQLSPHQREQADKVFRCGLKYGAFLWYGFVVLLVLVDNMVIPRLYHFKSHSPWMIILAGFVNLFAHSFATRWVRIAGLSQERVERHFIPRTVEFIGEPVEVRARNEISGWRYLLLWFSQSLLVLIVMYLTGLRVATLGWGFVLWPLAVAFFPSLALAFLRQPIVLQMDKNGVSSEVAGFRYRHLSWNQIAGADVVRVFNTLGNPIIPTLEFKDGSGKTVLKLSLLHVLIGNGRTDKERRDTLLNLVKAKFTGQHNITGALLQ